MTKYKQPYEFDDPEQAKAYYMYEILHQLNQMNKELYELRMRV